MANAANPVVPKDGALVITDASGTPKTWTVLYEDGDLQISGLSEDQWETTTFFDRGVPYAVRKIQKREIEFSFSCHCTAFLGDATTALGPEAILKKGVFSAAASVLPAANGDAYLLTLAFTAERSDLGHPADAVVTLKYCDMQMDFAEGVPGKLTISGRAVPLSNDYLTVS